MILVQVVLVGVMGLAGGWHLRGLFVARDHRDTEQKLRTGFTAGYQAAWAEYVNDPEKFLARMGNPQGGKA